MEPAPMARFRLLFLWAILLALASPIASSHSAYNSTAAPGLRRFAERDSGCAAGQLACPYFGCYSGPSCPAACTSRPDITSCAFSYNGRGCEWRDETCVAKVACRLNADGSCSSGCIGCGEFMCVPAGLRCPEPCAARPYERCGGVEAVNGIGCAWSSGVCTRWDPVNNRRISDMPVASEYVVQGGPTVLWSAVNTQMGGASASASPSPSSRDPSQPPSSRDPSQPPSPTARPSSEASQSHSSSSSKGRSMAASETDAPGSAAHDDRSSEPADDPSASDSVLSNASSAGPESQGPEDSGLSVGPIIGIVIGCLALLGLISWLVLYHMTKKSRQFRPDTSYLNIEKDAYHGAEPASPTSPYPGSQSSRADLISTAAHVAGVHPR